MGCLQVIIKITKIPTSIMMILKIIILKLYNKDQNLAKMIEIKDNLIIIEYLKSILLFPNH